METRQKILIVDDRKENLFALERVLRETDAEAIQAMNGNDALVASLNHDFALAIVDVQMPGMDGYELAELLRSEERTRHLPIVFLSAVYSDEHHVFKGYEAGAVDFITKPYNPKILLSKVNIFLQLDRQKRELIQKVELEKSKSYLESILLSMADPVIVLSPDASIRTVNKAALLLLGYEDHEIIGMSVGEILEDEDEEDMCWLPAPGPGGAPGSHRDRLFHNKEKNLLTKAGGKIPVLLSGSQFRNGDGAILGGVLLARDITERKRSDEQLRVYTSKLERSNRELQEFAFAASHDLQEPLRKIRTFGDRVMTKYRSSLDEEGRDYLVRMQNAAGRMQTLIQSLLNYSRVTTRAEEFNMVDLNSLVREVLSDLELRVMETGGVVDVDRLPTVEADINQMRQLFQNLICNALKFHGDGKPFIKIRGFVEDRADGRHTEGTRYRILVEDNGIGFDEKYSERIFAPFQRLHGRNAYEGVGMGLAICRKIVERHGGKITVASAPGKGSTFHITLPGKRQEELE